MPSFARDVRPMFRHKDALLAEGQVSNPAPAKCEET